MRPKFFKCGVCKQKFESILARRKHKKNIHGGYFTKDEDRNKNLIELWIDWNERKLEAGDFCMAFEKALREEIRQKINERGAR